MSVTAGTLVGNTSATTDVQGGDAIPLERSETAEHILVSDFLPGLFDGSVPLTETQAASARSVLGAQPYYKPEAYGVAFAAASPDAATNATNFQAFVDAHGTNETVMLPAGEIPLGGPIDLGQRNMAGQGRGASLLTFSGLASDEDALTVWGGPSGGGITNRAGNLRDFSIDCGTTGRDAIWFQGGIGCSLENVDLRNAVRDFVHLEQSADGRYFERFKLSGVNGNICGRYGICLQLVEFGASDTQFINKTKLEDFKFTRCNTADIGLRMEDNSTESGTKIGGGLLFILPHGSFNSGGDDVATREGCAVHIVRGSNSSAAIDSMKFDVGTFEDSTNNATANGALLIEDSNTSARTIVSDFISDQCPLTGYSRWWDYTDPDANPGIGNYTVTEQGGQIYTNRAIREFGTENGTGSVPAGGTLDLFDVSDGHVRDVYVGLSSGAGTYEDATVQGDSTTPLIRTTKQAGNLTLALSGTTLQAANAGGSNINIRWSAERRVSA